MAEERQVKNFDDVLVCTVCNSDTAYCECPKGGETGNTQKFEVWYEKRHGLLPNMDDEVVREIYFAFLGGMESGRNANE